MVSALIIADKYAKAAFAVAKKDGLVDKFSADLEKFTQNIQNGDFLKKLSNPTISKNNLGTVVANIGTKLSLDKKTCNFLVTIAKARRIKLIDQIYQDFTHLVKADKNIIEAQVCSVSELDQNQINQITQILQKRYYDKKIEITQKINKNILGGIIIKSGSLMIDASVKNQLEQLKQEFQLIIK